MDIIEGSGKLHQDEPRHLSEIGWKGDEYEQGVRECALMISHVLAMHTREEGLEVLSELLMTIDEARVLKLEERYCLDPEWVIAKASKRAEKGP